MTCKVGRFVKARRPLKSLVSPFHVALLFVSVLASTGNSGCTGTAESGSGVAGTGGAGGATETGGTTGPACDLGTGEVFAEIVAPPDRSFEEIAIAASSTEVGVAYTQWDEEAREVTVFFRRYSLDGTPLGEAVSLHTFDECCGQLASASFYGRPSVAAREDAFAVCWGEAMQIGCATIRTDTGEASFEPIVSLSNTLYSLPNVTATSDGFRVFGSFEGNQGLSAALGSQGDPVESPAASAVAIPSGFAGVSRSEHRLLVLDEDLSPTGVQEDLLGVSDEMAMTAFGDGLSLVDGGVEMRFGADGSLTTIQVVPSEGAAQMAVTAHDGQTTSAWIKKWDGAMGIRTVTAFGVAGPPRDVGCALPGASPSIAAIPGAFLVAAPLPEGAHEAFYATVVPRLRILRVPPI